MNQAEDALKRLNLQLPPPLASSIDMALPFSSIRVVDNLAYIAGHGPQGASGDIAGPFGKLGRDVSIEEGIEAARRTGLSILADLRRTLGSLDRIAAWGHVFVMVNSSPGFSDQPAVANGFSDLILDVFGAEVGRHSRSAIGVAALPFGGIPVEIEATVHLR